MKRIISVFLAVIMTMTMTLTVFAEGPAGGADAGGREIILHPGKIDLTGITYKAYQVMEIEVPDHGTLGGENVGKQFTDEATKLTYWTTKNFDQFFTSKGIETAQGAYEYLRDTNVDTIRSELKDYITENSIEPEGIGEGNGTEDISFGLQDPGYYILVPDNRDFAANLVVFTFNDEKAEAYVKTNKPTVDKKAEEEDWTSAQIGDTINFTVESVVPDMAGKTEYYFQLEDTMSNGLTVSEDTLNLVVTVGGQAVDPSKYEVTVSGQTLTIKFKNFLNDFKNDVGKAIVFQYSATLNEKAVSTNPETNSAKVHYGNDPDSLEDSTTDTVKVRTYKLTINKKAESEDGDPLSGAHFELYKADSAGNATGSAIELISLGDDNGNASYRVAKVGEGSTTTEVISPENGTITIDGLDANVQYVLVETKAPEGYNRAENQTINITAKSEDKGETVTIENDKVIVVNKAGAILPGTGGMGTIIFTVVAVVLIAGVAVSFIISRRKEA